MTAFPIGEAAFLIRGEAGDLEIKTSALPDYRTDRVAIICHPHPLYQGTMDNKVITTTAKAIQKLKFPVIRFNYRGVGKSQGNYGDTVGEAQDLCSIITWAKNTLPQAQPVLAGFSFGAFITLRVAGKIKEPLSLLAIAPAVHHERELYWRLASKIQCPYWVIMAGEDELVPVSEIENWHRQITAPTRLIKMDKASHFFHGRLHELQQHVQDWIQTTAV